MSADRDILKMLASVLRMDCVFAATRRELIDVYLFSDTEEKEKGMVVEIAVDYDNDRMVVNHTNLPKKKLIGHLDFQPEDLNPEFLGRTLKVMIMEYKLGRRFA